MNNKYKNNVYHRTLSLIKRAKNGEFPWIPTGNKRLNKVTYGVQKEMYYLISGGTGTGKTSYVLQDHIYDPFYYMYHNNKLEDFKTFFISLEMSPEMVMVKLISIHLYTVYKEQVPPSILLSKEAMLPDRVETMISDEHEFFEALAESVEIMTGKWTGEKLEKFLYKYFEKNGQFINRVDRDGNVIETIYKENNPKLITQVIVDHIGLLSKTSSLKSAIDDFSYALVKMRNLCRVTPVVLQQFNRDSTSTDRAKVKQNHRPKLSDLKDSSNPAQDAEIIIALMAPHKEELTTHLSYDVRAMNKKLIGLWVLKNRYGIADRGIGLNFKANVNKFKELPPAAEMTPEDYINQSKW